MMKSKDYVNIQEVCQQTGVAAVTLRAWERRYGLIKPERTPKGHRLYSDENIEEIRQILWWLDRGVAISKVAALLAADEKTMQTDLNEVTWDQEQRDLLSALINLKQTSLDPLLDKLNKSMPFINLCQKIYQPLLVQLMMRWQNKPLGYELEQQLWQQCWQRQLTIMTLRADKQKSRSNFWLINIDNLVPAVDYWLFYALLIQSGIRVNAINRLDDLSVLPRLRKSLDQPVIIFGNNKKTIREINLLVKVKALWGTEAVVLGRVSDIHHDTLTDMEIEHVGGDASTCWQSTCFQSWVDRVAPK